MYFLEKLPWSILARRRIHVALESIWNNGTIPFRLIIFLMQLQKKTIQHDWCCRSPIEHPDVDRGCFVTFWNISVYLDIFIFTWRAMIGRKMPNKYVMNPKLIIGVILVFSGGRVISCSDDYAAAAAAIVVTDAVVGVGTIR